MRTATIPEGQEWMILVHTYNRINKFHTKTGKISTYFKTDKRIGTNSRNAKTCSYFLKASSSDIKDG